MTLADESPDDDGGAAPDDAPDVSRRSLLQASGGVLGVGAGGWSFDLPRRCPDTTLSPAMRHCESADVEGCADDHPETERLRAAVEDALDRHYPTVGALIDQGYLPYFDFLTSRGPGGWSHWLNPDYIGGGTVLDPSRPEAVLVDNEWWRPLGVMFVATRDGERDDHPPAVYEDLDTGSRCAPWHYHVGLPGRYAWWKYRRVYDGGVFDGELLLPCRTPCVLHVWAHPNPNGVYAHDAPPRGERGGPPAEPAGFDTDAVPGEDWLSWDVLPEDLVDRLVG